MVAPAQEALKEMEADAPDPKATAAAQTQMNKETAITQYGLNATNLTGPGGKVTYGQIGTWADGTPRFEQTTTLSPEQQKLYDLVNSGYSKMGEAGNTLLDRIKASMSTPFNVDTAKASKIASMQAQFLDPTWKQNEADLEAQLQNRGLMPGSEGYIQAKQQFADAKARAYDSMYLSASDQALKESMTEHETPLNDLNTLLRGPTTAAPAAAAPTPGVAPVDYTGLVAQNFATQQSANNALMGAIGSAAGTAGGWAMSKYSDRRLKKDVQLIGLDPRGWGIYAFRYIWERARDALHRGFMADEVVAVRPDAVAVLPNGYSVVNYGVL